MILKVKHDAKSTLFNYIGFDYRNCVYLYANLAKYGLRNENMSMWTVERSGAVLAIIQKYFSCMHLYSKDDGWLSDELLNFITQEAPRTIFTTQDNARKLLASMSNRYYMKVMNLFPYPLNQKQL